MEGQERSVIDFEVDQNITCIRGLSPKKVRFEIEYGMERGSTVNSFLFTPKDKNSTPILIHPPSFAYSELFLERLERHIDSNIEKIYIVVGQINPKRVDLLKQLLKRYRNMTLYCSAPGAKILKELWNQIKPNQEKVEKIPNFPSIVLVKDQINIHIDNYELQLISTPNARWPGEVMVLEKKTGMLMSDKFFSAHIYTKEWCENTPASTEEDRRYFYECLMAPMSSQVNSIVEKLELLDIRSIVPCHGPAIESSWRCLLKDYQRWCEIKEDTDLHVILLFASAYGNTAAIADALGRGVSKTGIKVESINCEFMDSNQLIKKIQKADGYLIGSPTLGGHAPTPIVSALGALLSDGDRKHPIGIFGSYGWSGEALDLLENKLRDGGFTFGFKPIKIKFKPDGLMVKTIEETGTLFGRKLLQKFRKKKPKTRSGLISSKSDPALLALGRIVGSLCILTAKKGNDDKAITGAMVASWVSQASFSPPGLSISVAKDRAVESLLHKGDMFVLNILGIENHKKIMGQFLRSFEPGQNRLSGLILDESPEGQPIIPDAIAWLEGSVKDRMECGDHWVIYCEINNGKVLKADEVTAVHHRRTGTNY